MHHLQLNFFDNACVSIGYSRSNKLDFRKVTHAIVVTCSQYFFPRFFPTKIREFNFYEKKLYLFHVRPSDFAVYSMSDMSWVH